MKRPSRLWAFVMLSVACSAALAGEADDATPPFDIQRYQVIGTRLLSEEKIQSLLSAYAGERRNFGDIMNALQALEDALHAQGYRLVRVDLPEQDLTQGVVTLEVVETRIGRVTIEGNRQFDDANIRRSLPGLQEGTTPNVDAISRSLKLANDNPAKKTVLKMQAADKQDEVDAALVVTEESLWRTSLNLANAGTSKTGRTFASAVLQNANLFGQDHVVSMQYTTTIEHPDQVSVYGLGYRLPLYALGDSVDVFYTYSDVNVGNVTAGALNLAVSGKGSILGTRYNFTLPPSGNFRSKLVFGLDYKAYDNSLMAQGADLANDITVHPLSVAYDASWARTDGSTSMTLTLLRNLPGGTHGGAADFSAARSGANADYMALRFNTVFIQALNDGWQLNLIVNGQYTRDALIPGEQFGAGGAASVRGFEERKLANDYGLSGNLELFAPSRTYGTNAVWRALAFLDGAYVRRNHALPGETAAAGISSTGIGVRAQLGKQWSLQADYGYVLNAGALTDVSSSRLHFRANFTF